MSITMPERLDHARAALTAYFAAKGERLPEGPWDYEDTDASDLIADLLHLQKRLGMRDARRTLQTAVMHYEAEEAEPGAYHHPCALCNQVEISPPRFDGDTQLPDTEPLCSSRCQSDRILDPIEIS